MTDRTARPARIFVELDGFELRGNATAIRDLEAEAAALPDLARISTPDLKRLGRLMIEAQSFCFNAVPPSDTRAELVGSELWEVCIDHDPQHRLRRL